MAAAAVSWWSRAILCSLAVFFLATLLPHFLTRAGHGPWPWVYLLSASILLTLLLLAGVVAFVLWLTRFGQARRHMLRQWLIISITGLLMFPAAVLANVLISRDLPTGSFVHSFDAEVWKSLESSQYVEGDISPRQKMLGAVVDDVLPGRNRKEIEALLGPSTEMGPFDGNGHDLIYVTGRERSLFSIDSEWLLVWLDENDKFERCEVVTD